MATTSRGMGHNRFRSKISRQLKHARLTKQQEELLLATILGRFKDGDIDEQFIEQLRFALWLDRTSTRSVASKLLASDKPYVRRYAERVLNLGYSSVKRENQ